MLPTGSDLSQASGYLFDGGVAFKQLRRNKQDWMAIENVWCSGATELRKDALEEMPIRERLTMVEERSTSVKRASPTLNV